MAAQVPSRKYRIEPNLTEGGMGAIYVGKKIGPGGFEKEVVLKQLLPEFTSRPGYRERGATWLTDWALSDTPLLRDRSARVNVPPPRYRSSLSHPV